jgi:hypothetical protein
MTYPIPETMSNEYLGKKEPDREATKVKLSYAMLPSARTIRPLQVPLGTSLFGNSTLVLPTVVVAKVTHAPCLF